MASSTAMEGKVVLVTGATNGIGRVAARELARMGAHVIVVGRSQARIDETIGEIKQQTGSSKIDSLKADLSSMAAIRRLTEDFMARYDRLDVLVNNAGAFFQKRQESVDGFEMTFAVNHLNYFLLTNLLLDVLQASAPARIVNVSSDAHIGGPLKLDDLQSRQSYGGSGFLAYGQSKLANILFTYELARRLAGTGVTANALHPGFVATGFGKNNSGFMRLAMSVMQLFALTPEQGADTIIYLASAPEVEGVSGQYFEKRKAKSSSPHSYDEDAARRLWEISEKLTTLVPAAQQ